MVSYQLLFVICPLCQRRCLPFSWQFFGCVIVFAVCMNGKKDTSYIRERAYIKTQMKRQFFVGCSQFWFDRRFSRERWLKDKSADENKRKINAFICYFHHSTTSEYQQQQQQTPSYTSIIYRLSFAICRCHWLYLYVQCSPNRRV